MRHKRLLRKPDFFKQPTAAKEQEKDSVAIRLILKDSNERYYNQDTRFKYPSGATEISSLC